ncbi:phage shock envelope stress response protein PspM [Haloechinothrix sp. LS1_15]|uniref:phage shock envelope stress response protein PspM n=1 Tax=Haloechinothrix sp. LS1_15 TaxID=2652248 RepID=UPI002944B218|nr:hypothetical protein [Haloechinothrix sp. LS1_15]MDV6012166.1 hypothetical protein [Haloechinothrix sp. LS1_15]
MASDHQQVGGAAGERPSAGPPAAARQPNPLAELPVVADIRESLARWNDPAARLERRKRRTSRALTVWTVVTLLFGLAAVAGAVSAGQLTAMVFLALAGSITFGAVAVRSGIRLRSLHRQRVPPGRSRASLPAPGSAAHEPMRRLARAESSLDELLAQLRTADGGGAGAPADGVRGTADEAAHALRGLAARIEAIERARESAPVSEHAALDAALSTLHEQLEDGLEGYGSLVAAAGQAVAATDTGHEGTRQALVDATDRVAGLAIALRELR